MAATTRAATAAAVRASVRAANAAFNATDFDEFIKYNTLAGLAASLPDVEGASVEDYREAFEARAGQHQEITEISDIEVDGDEAKVTAASAFSHEGSDPNTLLISASRNELILEDGVWKFNGEYEWISPRIPDGVTIARLTADEYAWEFAADDFKDGDIAIEVRNAGQEQHMVDIRRAPADLDLAAWAKGDAPAEDVQPVIATPPIEPGETRVLTVTGAFKPGRYFLTCFIKAPDAPPDTYHLNLGMYAEFSVEQ